MKNGKKKVKKMKNRKTFDAFIKVGSDLQTYTSSVSGSDICLYVIDELFLGIDNMKKTAEKLLQHPKIEKEVWYSVKFSYSYEVGTHLNYEIIDVATLTDYDKG